MAIIIVLPALAMMLIGLGLVFRDGIAIVLGLATAGLALVFTAGLISVVWIVGGD